MQSDPKMDLGERRSSKNGDPTPKNDPPKLGFRLDNVETTTPDTGNTDWAIVTRSTLRSDHKIRLPLTSGSDVSSSYHPFSRVRLPAALLKRSNEGWRLP